MDSNNDYGFTYVNYWDTQFSSSTPSYGYGGWGYYDCGSFTPSDW